MSEQGIENLKRYEGYSATVYKCPAGFDTIGYGHNIEANPLTDEQMECFKIDPALTADAILRSDVEVVEKATLKKKPFIEKDPQWNQARINAILDMGFNMGVGWIDKWPNTWKMLENHEWRKAADSIRKSKYASQVGKRARNNAYQIETGTYL